VNPGDVVYLAPDRWFHLTGCNLGRDAVLRPSSDFSMADFYSPAGVSFSPTIDKALDALPFEGTEESRASSRLHVYTPKKRVEAIVPGVEDLEFTSERRALSAVPVELVGIIGTEFVRQPSGYGKWIWKWIQRNR